MMKYTEQDVSRVRQSVVEADVFTMLLLVDARYIINCLFRTILRRLWHPVCLIVYGCLPVCGITVSKSMTGFIKIHEASVNDGWCSSLEVVNLSARILLKPRARKCGSSIVCAVKGSDRRQLVSRMMRKHCSGYQLLSLETAPRTVVRGSVTWDSTIWSPVYARLTTGQPLTDRITTDRHQRDITRVKFSTIHYNSLSVRRMSITIRSSATYIHVQKSSK